MGCLGWRCRNFRVITRRRRNYKSGEVSHFLKNYSGPSFSSLPSEILADVLVRLSVKKIFVCKPVCKTFYDLISSHEFAKLHFEQCHVYPLVRFESRASALYLVQPEKDQFDRKLDMCDYSDAGPRLRCACSLNVVPDTKFDFPMYNQCMIDDDSEGKGVKFGKPDSNHRYDIVNSCNGLLCLSSPSDNDPVIVCNPVTGEFIKLPVPERIQRNPVSISCFDIEKELFRKVETPPVKYIQEVRMGVLGEELCLIESLQESFQSCMINVWVMKDSGTEKEWSKLISFNLDSYSGHPLYGLYEPIKYLNDGALLVSLTYGNVLLYKDPRKHGAKSLKLPFFSRAEVIAHNPSFVSQLSLKQALSGLNVKVLKVKSRCTGLELHGKGNGRSIVEGEVPRVTCGLYSDG